jgi:spermidine synthase
MTETVGRICFAVATFLSAALLFMVQPMAGKILLPLLGGSPAVWNTCMVFFQLVLLAAYGYAHVLATRFSGRFQVLLHVAIMLIVASLPPPPIDVGAPGPADGPQAWLVKTLVLTVGLPFFTIAGLAPLLQSWFSRIAWQGSRDPYPLYAASNTGSIAGLLAYPLVVEPWLTRSGQFAAWTWGFRLLAITVGLCGWLLATRGGDRDVASGGEGTDTKTVSGLSQRAFWCLLAGVPSSLVLGVTQLLATDVASIPLLWVIPLTLYLATYVLAFSPRIQVTSRTWGMLAVPTLLGVVWLMLDGSTSPLWLIFFVHLANFFLLAMCCHKRLEESRPAADQLTTFYFCISLGGLIGGLFSTLIAPRIFTTIAEYPIALGVACLLRPPEPAERATKPAAWRQWLLLMCICVAVVWALPSLHTWLKYGGLGWLASSSAPAAAVIGALTPHVIVYTATVLIPCAALLASLRWRRGPTFALLVTALTLATTFFGVGRTLYRERTFFGVLRVSDSQSGLWHVLTHGSTTHGVESTTGSKRLMPTSYYHPTGPVGSLVRALHADQHFKNFAVIGLGVGTLAAYCVPGTEADFFEIDSAVIRIAENPAFFSYLTDMRNRPGTAIRTHHNDGRLGMAETPDDTFDLVVVDAFSSDAIPTHLITLEAIAIYAQKCRPHGIVAFNISNRHFELRPVLADIGASLGMTAGFMLDDMISPAARADGKHASLWVALTKTPEDFATLVRENPAWQPLRGTPQGPHCWTDDYSSVLGVLR